MRLIAVGSAIGLAGYLALGNVLQAMLYEVGPHDPLALGTVVAVLAAVGAVATYGPARRAASVDPVEALR